MHYVLARRDGGHYCIMNPDGGSDDQHDDIFPNYIDSYNPMTIGGVSYICTGICVWIAHADFSFPFLCAPSWDRIKRLRSKLFAPARPVSKKICVICTTKVRNLVLLATFCATISITRSIFARCTPIRRYADTPIRGFVVVAASPRYVICGYVLSAASADLRACAPHAAALFRTPRETFLPIR